MYIHIDACIHACLHTAFREPVQARHDRELVVELLRMRTRMHMHMCADMHRKAYLNDPIWGWTGPVNRCRIELVSYE